MVRFITLAGLTTALWGVSLQGPAIYKGGVQFITPAYAQSSINVRAGEHDGYSRLVFDGVSSGDYTLDKMTGGQVVIGFKGQGDITGQNGAIDALRNVSGVKVLSEAPLKISLNIPADSNVRDFSVGDRLIFDVYNSPSKAVPKEAGSDLPQKASKPKTAPKKSAQVAPDKVMKKPKRSAELDKLPKPTEPVKAPKAEQDQNVEMKTAQPVTPVQAQSTLKIEASKTDPSYNLMSLSDTASFGMAAFEHNGEVVFINDSQNYPVLPNVKGPQSSELNPPKQITLEGAMAFKFPDLEGFSVDPNGGGLLWRIGLTNKAEERQAVAVQRVSGPENAVRGGKVVWTFDEARNIYRVNDPLTGENLFVVTVDDSMQFAGEEREFVDFKVLKSPIGLAILPKVDDLSVVITEDGAVEISRPEGLTVLAQDFVEDLQDRIESKKRFEVVNTDWDILYDFPSWEFGNVDDIGQTRNLILGRFSGINDPKAVEGYIKLARMYIANGMGEEALGFINLAEAQLPGIGDNIEFKGLRAAAEVLGGRYKEAFFNFSQPVLQKFEETGYWKAAALAELGDWQQAREVVPEQFDIFFNYPAKVFNPLALDLAEIFLRSGETDLANEILRVVRERRDTLFPFQDSKLTYLTGEALRQQGDYNRTIREWNRLAKGDNDLFRTRAILALTRLNAERGKMDMEEQINNLERLRYSWRGDELEAQINYWLGKAYFDEDQYARGLNILREATTYAEGANLSERIAAEMRDLYADLFLTDQINELTPLDAAALYEQFTELAPTGEAGDRLVERLAERLQRADLLDRASSLLDKQLEFRLKGMDAYRVAVRLTLIKLIDEKPLEALKYIDKAQAVYETLPEEVRTPERSRELISLRARALAFRERPDLAIKLLEEQETHPDLNKLVADIAWSASYWDDAAYALEQVIIDRDISLTRPLSKENAILILNRAVALNLATDRIALANMREKYTDSMNQTSKGKIFEVVTRPRQSVTLADRETLTSIVQETDLFADFMENYSDYSDSAANLGPVDESSAAQNESSESQNAAPNQVSESAG